MMFQHTMAQMVAEEMKASMYIQVPRVIPETGEYWYPPNTAVGDAAVQSLLPLELIWDKLPDNHPHKELCQRKNITFYDRPKDSRKQSGLVKEQLAANINRMTEDMHNDFCLVMLGYFQSVQPDMDSAKAMWNGYSNFPLNRVPQPLDLGIYLRCTPHYTLFSKLFYCYDDDFLVS
jgi:hypothetical protein